MATSADGLKKVDDELCAARAEIEELKTKLQKSEDQNREANAAKDLALGGKLQL